MPPKDQYKMVAVQAVLDVELGALFAAQTFPLAIEEQRF